MASLRWYVVDAFVLPGRPFSGNPAAVVPLQEWLPDATLQAMAAQHNLSETAFVKREGEGWRLRWFTPATEVPLCGHATLAASLVLERELGIPPPHRFVTLSGVLGVEREGEALVLDFPARMPARVADPPPAIAAALGAAPREVWLARDWIAVFDDAASVRALAPDHAAVAALPGGEARLIATAPGEAGADCVSRYFAAKVGIAEDPVTGAAHTQLVPFWAERLGKPRLVCLQASRRGGLIVAEHVGERVRLAGRARLYARGEILLDG